MKKAEIFIESNSALKSVHPGDYELISKHNALRAIEIQKKADEEFFRSFILKVTFCQAMGEHIDLEKEFNEKYSAI